ncbi:MAG: hypothetical protein BWY44_00540 [Candidatus Omnitrophica bacterium ADurb.Bin292]|nr:MAG: hypothetical protein BWY44_00540 [Candidatus Omnitrophica bacterium ADurb.Bin292]
MADNRILSRRPLIRPKRQLLNLLPVLKAEFKAGKTLHEIKPACFYVQCLLPVIVKK